MKIESIALIPAFNEEKSIEEVISRLKKIGLKSIVIDDGSTDKTNELAKKSNTIAIKHTINMGKGEALKTGFNYVLKNLTDVKYVVVIDADMQYSPEEAIMILKTLKEGNADFVMGYRNWRIVPYSNAFGNFVWRLLFNFFFGTNLKDTNCGFIGLKKNAIKKIKDIHGGYIIENSILRDVVKNNLKIKQVPVNVIYKKTHTSHFARMFFGILIFITTEGLRYKLSKI